MPKHARELAVALRNLAAGGAIEVAGQDPLPGAPLAFRLAKASSRHENVEAMGDLPRRPSPPLIPDRRTDRSMTAVKRESQRSASLRAPETSAHSRTSH
jgi:hypothetical protein